MHPTTRPAAEVRFGAGHGFRHDAWHRLWVRLFFVEHFPPIHGRLRSRALPLRCAVRGDSIRPRLFSGSQSSQPGLITTPGRFGPPLRRTLDIRAAFWYGSMGKEMPLRWP